MPAQHLKHRGRVLRPRHATTAPDFGAETVLVSDPWEYVELWLKRKGHDNARAHWQQAREFFTAASELPPTSAPLPAYYCFLNAAKALLDVRGQATTAAHGVHGQRVPGSRSLDAESVHFHSNGVLGGLCRVLDEPTDKVEYTLKDALYNLPFVHRAYCLTFTSAPELYLPVKNPRFVRKRGSKEAWLAAELEARYVNKYTEAKLPSDWEFDHGPDLPFGTIRMKKRFQWHSRGASSSQNLQRLQAYHCRVRRSLQYIFGPSRLWYLKRGQVGDAWIERSPVTLSFAIMHRLSELSRYDPVSLRQHLERQHNWLLSEYVAVASRQFIDEMASEITGCDFMVPGIRR